MSIASLLNWFFYSIVAFTFLKLVNTFFPAGAFWFYAAMGVVGIMGYYYIPETIRVSLESIEDLWKKGKQLRELK